MARPRKPTQLKIVQGTYRKDRANPHEPPPQPRFPSCPRELSDTAKKEWRRLAPELHQLGLLTALDRAGLVLYCQAYSDWALAVQKLQTDGFTVEHPKRGTAVSPWFRIQRAAAEQVRRLSLDFSLTPAARAKLDVPPPAEAARAAKLDRIIGRFGIRPDTKPTIPGPDA